MLPINSKSSLILTTLAVTLVSTGVMAQTLKDPTRPAVVIDQSGKGPLVNAADGKLVLNSITWMGNRAFAVINNKIYYRGDSVQGNRISRISRDQVELEDGRKLVLFTTVTEK